MKITENAWGEEYCLIGGTMIKQVGAIPAINLRGNVEMLVRNSVGTTIFGLTLRQCWSETEGKFYYVVEVDKEASKLAHKPEVHIVVK